MGGKRHDIWAHFRVINPAVKGEKQHPDVQCKYCGNPIRNAQRKKNLAEHLSNPKKCGKAPHDVELELDFAELFYATGIPFRIVEDPAVKRFFAKACPSFRLPSRQRIAGPLLEEMYKKRKLDVVEQLKQQQYLALSTDGWSDANNTSIVNFMLVSPTMKPVFWSSVNTGEEEHTGVYIAACIDRVIEEVETAIGRKRAICAVVTDNARNMKSAWKEVQTTRPYVYCNGCAAHAFNLLMKDVMKISRLAGVRDDSKSVAKFVRARHGLLDRFRSQQKAILRKGESRIALSVPIPTRWYTVENNASEAFLKTKVSSAPRLLTRNF
ncbi:hypothetical protein PHMEG_0002930 [Phytophthora megakarya]|uniref:BED-type domain-containing protein n=1 Tax=Phytophthora megakarya TaxID=4795 RepID=A0A225WXV7_9STRA|nr:hypothetical protein PHMEG_0002930 [Phytophthora megakarya]